MVTFQYHSPVQIRFGYGARNGIDEVAGRFGCKGFLVVDPGVADGELFAEFREKRAPGCSRVCSRGSSPIRVSGA